MERSTNSVTEYRTPFFLHHAIPTVVFFIDQCLPVKDQCLQYCIIKGTKLVAREFLVLICVCLIRFEHGCISFFAFLSARRQYSKAQFLGHLGLMGRSGRSVCRMAQLRGSICPHATAPSGTHCVALVTPRNDRNCALHSARACDSAAAPRTEKQAGGSRYIRHLHAARLCLPDHAPHSHTHRVATRSRPDVR